MTPYAVFQNNILQNKNLSKHFWGEWEGHGTMVEIRAKKGRKRTGIQTTPMPRGTSAKDGYSFHGSTCRCCTDTSEAWGIRRTSPPPPHKTQWSTCSVHALCLKSSSSRATTRNNYLLCLSNWIISSGHFCSSVKSQQFYSLFDPYHIPLQHSFPFIK